MERYPAVQQHVVTVPARQAHTATVIFLHGIGQSNLTWRMLILEALAPRLPHIKWLLPQAPTRRVISQPCNRQPSWFNVSRIPPSADEFDEQTISESTTTIEDLILAEVHAGIDSRRIVLIGHGQGAALALMVALTSLHYLGGAVALSGWLPVPIRQSILYSSCHPPVLWCHGGRDREIPAALGQDAISFLQQSVRYSSRRLTTRIYPNMGHAIEDPELEDICCWLSRILGTS